MRWSVGTGVAGYRLVEILAEGGMGAVWIAEGGDGQRVAIKQVSTKGAKVDPASRQRLIEEGARTARVDNPHVVTVHDQGVTEDGQPYVVMELLEGEGLDARLVREERLPVEVAVSVVRHVAIALSAAHRVGLVHRDIKPGNIFLCAGHDPPLAKLLDFGLAKPLDQTRREKGLTAPGMMVGTPRYLSPDQLKNPSDLDPHRDLWALAVVAYRALTGAQPFPGKAVPQVVEAILSCAFVPPSQLAPSLPPEIDAWFSRALHRDRDQRFATAAELARSFANVLRFEPVEIVTPSRSPLSVMLEPEVVQPAVAEHLAAAAPEPLVTSRLSMAPIRSADEPLVGVEELCLAELSRTDDPLRRARLHFELGEQAAERDDDDRALRHHEEAHAHEPHLRAAIAAVRQILVRRGEAATAWFERELERVGDRSERAALLLAQARAAMDDAAALRAEAAAMAPADLRAQRAHLADLRVAESWTTAIEVLERVETIAADQSSLRAAWMAHRAQLHDAYLDDPDRAIALHQEALRIDPDHVASSWALQRLLRRGGHWSQLVKVLEALIGRTADGALRAALWGEVATVYGDELGDVSAAATALERAWEAAPGGRLLAWRQWALAARHGDEAGVVRALERCAELADGADERAQLAVRLGHVLERRDPARARAWFAQAHTLDPRDRLAMAGLARLYAAEERWAELVAAWAAHAQLVDERDRAAEAEATAAGLLERLGDLDGAASRHTRALTLRPARTASLDALVSLHRRRGQLEDLAATYEWASERASDAMRPLWIFEVATLYERELGDLTRAAAAYQRLAAEPDSPLRALVALERVGRAAGDADLVLEALDRQIEVVEDAARARELQNRAAAHCLEERDEAAAERRFRAVLEEAPDDATARLALERLLRDGGRDEELCAHLEEGLDFVEDDESRARLCTEIAGLVAHDLERACRWYDRALVEAPGFTAARRAKLWLVRRVGSDDDREAELVALLDEAPNDIGLELELAGLRERSDRERAADHYRHVLDRVPGEPWATRGLMRCLVALDDHEALAALLGDEAGRRSTEQPAEAWAMTIEQAALVAHRADDPRRARALLEQARTDLSDDLSALTALEALHEQLRDDLDRGSVAAGLQSLVTLPVAKAFALEEVARQRLRAGESCTDELYVLAALAADASAVLPLLELVEAAADPALSVRGAAIAAATSREASLAAWWSYRWGQHARAAGDRAAAEEAFRQVLAHDPQRLAAIRGLGAIASERGDCALQVEMLEREARWAQSPAHRAGLLVRVAMLRAGPLEDAEGAATDAERALELWPDHEDAAAACEKLWHDAGLFDRWADRFAHAARRAALAKRQLALWRTVAGVHSTHRGDSAAAVTAWERCRTLAPDDLEIAMQLVHAHEQNHDPRAAFDLLGELVPTLPDDWDPTPLRARAARLASRLHLPEEAVALWKQVVEADPDRVAAWWQLAELHEAQGAADEALACLREVVRAVTTVAEQVRALMKVAALEHAAGREGEQVSALRAAVALEGPRGDAAVVYKKLLGRAESFASYADVLGDHIVRAQAGELPRDRLGDVYVELARVQNDHLRQPREALATIDEGLARVGSNITSLTIERARQLSRMGWHDRAIAAFEAAIAVDPSQVVTWRGLAEVRQLAGDGEGAAVAMAPVLVLDTPTEVERNLAARLARGPFRPGSLDAAAIRPLLVDASHEEALGALVELLAPALQKAHPIGTGDLGVSRRDRVHEGPLWTVVEEIASAAGWSRFDLFVRSGDGVEVAAVPGRTPALVVPSLLAEASAGHLAFAVARAVVRERMGLPFGAQREALVPAIAAVAQGGETAPPALVDAHRDLWRHVRRKDRRPIVEAAAPLTAITTPHVEAWLRAAESWACRVAAVVSADLMASVEVTARHEGVTARGIDLVRAHPSVADLLRFWGSTNAASLRVHLNA